MIRPCSDADLLSDVIRALGRTVERQVEMSCEGRESRGVFAAHDPEADAFEWRD